MAFDGFAVANIRHELTENIEGYYISKITQPESDELIITFKGPEGNRRLLLSANPSLPLAHLTENNKPAPLTAPNFCMLLRKHLGGGRVLAVRQPSLERILEIQIEHRDEMGDLCQKALIIELMGKHSNIIFTDDSGMIIDSIRRVPAHVSSVREVLPGKPYFIPQTTEKLDPFSADEDAFKSSVFTKPSELSTAIYTSLTGFSPAMAEELCTRAGLDGRADAKGCGETEKLHLFHVFERMMDEVKNAEFTPSIFYRGNVPEDFSALESERYPEDCTKHYSSISQLLEDYYAEKETISRIRQRSFDLRRIVSTALERNVKKLGILEKQYKDTEKKDKYRIRGELLNTYGYECAPGDRELKTINYYTGEPVTIPLDPKLSASENAKKYFERYNKLKRTEAACKELIEETTSEISYLESIQTSLELAGDESDLMQIKQELSDTGYIKKHSASRKGGQQRKAQPLHFLSSDGFDIYVGKNNYQNDMLTFDMASGNDWWFHSKQIPGSHVILKTNGREVPDKAFEEAASLAAYYSKARNSDKVEIDYTLKKNIKKPNKAKPGFVVYYTNYSMVAKPCIDSVKMI